MNQSMQKCLFLDRDGIINKDIGYAYKPEHVEFVPGIFELCRFFQQKGYLLIVVTNQSGIARGYYSEEDFTVLNQWLKAAFTAENIHLSDIFHCPHHPDITGPCNCRKPAPGMLLEAIKKYRIDPQFSIMIGDKPSDMEAAMAANIRHRILLAAAPDTKAPAATALIKALNDIYQLDLS